MIAGKRKRRPAQISAGILAYRRGKELEVLLAHPGGPFWAKKDASAWTIPKGLIEPGDDPIDAARREFQEETGLVVDGEMVELAPVRTVLPWKQTSISRYSPAILSRSSGRQNPASDKPFPKSTVSRISPFRSQKRRYLPISSHSYRSSRNAWRRPIDASEIFRVRDDIKAAF